MVEFVSSSCAVDMVVVDNDEEKRFPSLTRLEARRETAGEGGAGRLDVRDEVVEVLDMVLSRWGLCEGVDRRLLLVVEDTAEVGVGGSGMVIVSVWVWEGVVVDRGEGGGGF